MTDALSARIDSALAAGREMHERFELKYGPIRKERDELAAEVKALRQESAVLLNALKFALSDESGFACPTVTEERLRAAIAKADGKS